VDPPLRAECAQGEPCFSSSFEACYDRSTLTTSPIRERMPAFGLLSISRLSRLVLLALVVAAPWPFGSVTPRSASILTASVLILFGIFWSIEMFRGQSLQAPPALPWIAIGLALVLFQSLPWPGSLSDLVAPAVGLAYRPLRDEQLSVGWHPLSLEPFQARWLGVQLLDLKVSENTDKSVKSTKSPV